MYIHPIHSFDSYLYLLWARQYARTLKSKDDETASAFEEPKSGVNETDTETE